MSMGVNATATLGGLKVERRRRENQGAVSGEGSGLGRGCAPSQKIYEFLISKWCDMVQSGCDVFKIHECRIQEGKNKTLVKILGGGWQHRTTPAGQILAVATPAALTPMPTSANNVTQLAFAADRRAAVDVDQKVAVPAAEAPCSNRSTLPARGTYSSKPAAAACSRRMTGQTDSQQKSIHFY